VHSPCRGPSSSRRHGYCQQRPGADIFNFSLPHAAGANRLSRTFRVLRPQDQEWTIVAVVLFTRRSHARIMCLADIYINSYHVRRMRRTSATRRAWQAGPLTPGQQTPPTYAALLLLARDGLGLALAGPSIVLCPLAAAWKALQGGNGGHSGTGQPRWAGGEMGWCRSQHCQHPRVENSRCSGGGRGSTQSPSTA